MNRKLQKGIMSKLDDVSSSFFELLLGARLNVSYEKEICHPNSTEHMFPYHISYSLETLSLVPSNNLKKKKEKSANLDMMSFCS